MSTLKTASFLGIVAIITGVLNYASHPLLLRYLSNADYVEVMVYSSLLAIISIPLWGFGMYLLTVFRSEKVASFISRNFIKKLTTYSYWLAFFLVIAISICCFIFDLSFGFGPFFLFITLLPSVFSTYFSSYILSKELFILNGKISLATSVVRFFISLCLIIFPFFLTGLSVFFVPALLASVLTIYFGYRYLEKDSIRDLEMTEIVKKKVAFLKILKSKNLASIAGFLLISATVILLQNVDVIIVHSLFSDSEATRYLAVAVLVKFALVFIGIFETLYMPVLVDARESSLHRQYITNLFLLSILGYVVSLTVLPYVGNYTLSLIKNGLTASYFIWAFLGIAMVSLWFFSIFSKVLVAQSKKLIHFFVLPFLVSIAIFFSSSIEMFAIIYATVITVVYFSVLFSLLLQKA